MVADELAASLVDSCPDGILAFDPAFRYTLWNRAMERISGVPAAEVLGRVAWEAFPFLKEEGEDAYLEAALAGRTVRAADRRFRVRDGRQGFYRAEYAPVRDAAGQVVGGMGVVHETTDGRRAEEVLRLQGLILDSMSEGVSVSDEDGVILYTNPAEDRMFGYAPGELVGRHVSVQNAYPPEENQRRVAEVIERLRRDGEWVGEWENVRRDGTPFRTRSRIRALEIGGRPHWVCVQDDLTERGRAEAEKDRLAGRLDFLAAAGAALSSSLDYDTTLRTVAHLAVPALADWCFVEALQPDGSIQLLAVGHPDPEQVRLAEDTLRRYPVSLDAPFGTGRVVRTGEPEVAADIPAEVLRAVAQDAEHLEILLRIGFRSSVTVPLAVHGATVGAFTLAQSTSGRRFGEGDLPLVQEVAARAAAAMENARLFRAEREAHAAAEQAAARARGLQRLTARLNEATSREQIADVIFQGSLQAVGADAGSLAVVHAGADGAPGHFEIVRDAGYTQPVVERFRTFPVTAGRPLSESVLRREIVLVGSLEEWRARFPGAPDLAESGYHAFAAVPVVAGDQPVAALSFSFREPRDFDEGTRTFLATVGEQCALALERQRLHEAELRHAARHAALLETIQDGFVAFDRELRYTYANPRAEELLRTPAAGLLGRRMDEVFPAAAGTPLHDALVRALETGRAAQLEVMSVAAGRWVDVRLYPGPDGVSMAFRDVTERRRQQEATELMAEASRLLSASLDYEETLRALAEAAVPRLGDWCAVSLLADPAAGEWPPRVERIAVVHRDPRKLALGEELSRRYPTDWSSDTGMAAVVRNGTPFFLPEVTAAMVAAGARDAEHLALLRAIGFASVIVVPLIARGLTLGTLTLCATESGRRYDEVDLVLVQDIAARAATAVDNARLFRDAERARAEAEAANRSKSDFLASMSHELRTPLNAIGGYVELIRMGIRGPVTPEQQADLERVQRGQRHLLGLINEVLNYARLESGAITYDLRPTDAAEVVAATTPLVEPQRAARGIALEVRAPDALAAVVADRDKLQQILLNLLSNAVKFTPPGGRITVQLAEEGDGTVALRVSDTGIGIPADRLDAVFEPFVQVGRALNHPAEGAGLGLAISRDLARAMAGDLVAESTLGEGSTFTLRLPRA
jgi:PAS domain S-box-containing protein